MIREDNLYCVNHTHNRDCYAKHHSPRDAPALSTGRIILRFKNHSFQFLKERWRNRSATRLDPARLLRHRLGFRNHLRLGKNFGLDLVTNGQLLQR